jgi:hypothetical protein
MAEEVGIALRTGQTKLPVYPDSLHKVEMVRASGNAPDPGTDLVRLSL